MSNINKIQEYIKLNETSMRIRPSTVKDFLDCPFKWAKRHLEGVQSLTNHKAAIGTGVHASAEQFWEEVIAAQDPDKYNISAMIDRGVAALDEEIERGVDFGDEGDNRDTAIKLISNGAIAFADDIGCFTPFPDEVEAYYEVEIDHWLVTSLGGTIDYRAGGTVGDIKTSSRKPTPSSYVIQQSIYTYLVEANGIPVTSNIIQGITLGKTKTEGNTMALTPNVPQAKFAVNSILDRLDVVQLDTVPLHVLFPGNPNTYLCSDKWCPNYKTCPFVNGAL